MPTEPARFKNAPLIADRAPETATEPARGFCGLLVRTPETDTVPAKGFRVWFPSTPEIATAPANERSATFVTVTTPELATVPTNVRRV